MYFETGILQQGGRAIFSCVWHGVPKQMKGSSAALKV